MDRRAFTGTLAASLLGGAWAQTAGKVARIGVITWMPAPQPFHAALRHGLREHGWEEGRNIHIEWRAADAHADRLDGLARELARLRVDVIVAEFTPAAQAARRATSTIPIVMAPAGDPVATGLIASLARPGGNVTGLSNVAPELAGKRLQLLREIVPGLVRVGLLVFGGDALDRAFIESTRRAAVSAAMQIEVAEVPVERDIERAFATLKAAGVGAVIVPGNLPLPAERTAALALQHRLPTIGVLSNFPAQGGLMAYAPNLADIRRGSAGFVDQLLRGARAQDLPVEQPTIVDLIINLKTAKALGLTIPQSLHVRADEVLQ